MNILENRCDNITAEKLAEIMDSIKIVHKNMLDDDSSGDGESILLQSCYSGKQTFGATDYKDHREDTLSMLKNKILPLKIFQLGHFYDSNGEQVDTLVLSGYHGGYTGTFLYKSGKNAFNR